MEAAAAPGGAARGTLSGGGRCFEAVGFVGLLMPGEELFESTDEPPWIPSEEESVLNDDPECPSVLLPATNSLTLLFKDTVFRDGIGRLMPPGGGVGAVTLLLDKFAG